MFEVGDRVRYEAREVTNSPEFEGLTGTVTSYSNGSVNVNWDQKVELNFGVLPGNLQLVDKYKVHKTALEEAKKLVYGNREDDYGHPWDDFSRTSAMWSTILGTEVTPEQYALCMIAVKISRLINDPTKRDSWVDIAGYAECYDRLQSKRNENG